MFTGLYELNVFGIQEATQIFLFGDAPVAIRFTDQTVFVDLAESIHRISRESFRFRN